MEEKIKTPIEFIELLEFKIGEKRIAYDKTHKKWIHYGYDEEGEYEEEFENPETIGIQKEKFDKIKTFVEKSNE